MKKIINVIGISVIITVILFCLGSCYSMPSLTQAEMKYDDPRRPPDRFDRWGDINNYWYGSRASGLSRDQVSVFNISSAIYSLTINGNSLSQRRTPDKNGFIYLTPGKYILKFTFDGGSRQMGNGDSVRVRIPNVQMEVDFEPGYSYSIILNVTDITDEDARASFNRYIAGYGGKYSMSLSLDSRKLTPQRNVNSTTLQSVRARKYLEPFDDSIPFEMQSFIETTGKVYITSFNGQSVVWGRKGNNVTIGIPPGRHILQVRISGKKEIYTVNINCVSGFRYIIYPLDNRGLKVDNITNGTDFVVWKNNNK